MGFLKIRYVIVITTGSSKPQSIPPCPFPLNHLLKTTASIHAYLMRKALFGIVEAKPIQPMQSTILSLLPSSIHPGYSDRTNDPENPFVPIQPTKQPTNRTDRQTDQPSLLTHDLTRSPFPRRARSHRRQFCRRSFWMGMSPQRLPCVRLSKPTSCAGGFGPGWRLLRFHHR